MRSLRIADRAPADARLHVVGGLLGEGQRQDALAIDSLPHQVNEATGQRRGLAGAGTGQNQLDAPGPGRRGLLRWIEGAHRLHRDCSIVLPSGYGANRLP